MKRRHWHPSPEQTLLLHAALDRGPSSAAAWSEWKQGGGDIDTLDHRSFRLLALVAKNLAEQDVPDPDLGRLRGVRRRSWVEHINLMRRVAPYAGALVAGGLEVLFLKGVVLAPVYYGDLGLRMLSDVDVLVRWRDVPRAIALLAQVGVKPHGSYPPTLARALAGETNLADEGFRHSLAFANAEGHELDLHWAVMCSNIGPHVDEGFWARARPFSVGGVDGLTLSSTDHLLHAIVHGLSFSDTSTVRWITDALAILRSPKPEHAIDWNVLLDETASRGLLLPVREALEYLVNELGTPVPAWVMAHLAAARPTFMERLRYAELLQDWSDVRTPGVVVAGIVRFTEGRPPFEALKISSRYLKHRLDLRGPSYLASQVAMSLAGLLPEGWRETVRGWNWVKRTG